ncbi:MAG TPA: HAD family hydrolase [Anaerohalosphaeraceae bacterium]|nr:HAD family hydrolase [Anaerohalosphaeraceae bacterium]HOL31722.1 HAD family hydrolase [Anaerohalosphaeraceae bacterium]HOM75374.1 HAD family hydrolase [Anaerohalosphaeraceae bacterium]HPC64254.1 HAD family hydrolase [Anaerohalosphaeraceae bacterium]HPO69358.1 HAD family hydrolase [Anaerohalosphaeraceae bacterium]
MGHKAVFFDRDDTLIEDPGYIRSPDQVKLLPGVARSLIQLKKMGYLLIVVTNQSAVARGMITEQELEEIHRRLKNLLAAEGAYLDGIYYCPYHPEGTVAQYAKESNLRKPEPGMLLQAAREKDIDLSRSWVVGDRYLDIRMGRAAGCYTILVDVPGKQREKLPDDPEPDRKAVNIREAVNIIRMHEFHQKARSGRNGESSAFTETAQRAAVPEPKESQETDAQPPQQASDPGLEGAKSLSSDEVITLHETSGFESREFSTKAAENDQPEDAGQTHRLFEEILRHLKRMDRAGFYPEFSVFKLLAGMTQTVAVFCLIVSIGFWLNPKVGYEPVLIMIGYAIMLELLVIALLMMHGRD